jgi:hypothetical protein
MAGLPTDAPINGALLLSATGTAACGLPPNVIAAATIAMTAPSTTTQTLRDALVLFHDLALATACQD